MKIFDVIIIGAGPAGAMAGYNLGKAGLNTLMIEKSTFPRRKVCGGGLTHHAYQQLPYDVSPVLHRSVEEGYISYRGKRTTRIKAKQPIAYLIDRASFDAFLLQKAIEQAVIFHDSQRVVSLNVSDEMVTVQTNRDAFRGRYLIGADGVHSLVAKQCHLIAKRRTSLSYEARLSYPSDWKDDWIESIIFDFGTFLCGYGWIFPKRDHLNVGVFRSWPGNQAGKRQLMRFIHQHQGLRTAELIDIRAYPVPLGGKRLDLQRGRALLAGDAANLADPWLGEGLYYALTSGRMAAEAILAHLNGQIYDLSGYTRQINETLTTQLGYARRLSSLMHTFPYLNVRAFSASPTLQAMVIDLLRGDQSYQQIWEAIIKGIPKRVRHFLRKLVDK